MDTGSHLLLGATLAGLAHLDPTVGSNAVLGYAVLVSTMAGSHAPDLDAVTRLKGFSTYLRHHRGISHSVPAWFLWPMLIATPIAMLFGVMDQWLHVYAWTLAAVVLHVMLDWMNAYGVQWMRPFTRRWAHKDILCLFEPLIFGLHAVGLIGWLLLGWEPGVTFTSIYGLTALYIGIRAIQHRTLIRLLKRHYTEAINWQLVPGLHWMVWQYLIESEDGYTTGTIRWGRMEEEQVYAKEEQGPIIQATLQEDGVQAFLSFAERIHVSWKERHDGYEVRWSDVRFNYKKRLAFGVDLMLDRELKVVRQRVGYRKKGFEPPYL